MLTPSAASKPSRCLPCKGHDQTNRGISASTGVTHKRNVPAQCTPKAKRSVLAQRSVQRSAPPKKLRDFRKKPHRRLT